MKKFAILSIAGALSVSSVGVFAQSAEPTKNGVSAEASEPAKRREWLKQLVGEWDLQCKMYIQPDQPPAESAGTDSVRALGEHWVVAEAKSTMMGAPFNGILSLGYDPQEKRFHGTWIDSMGGHLWVYKGTLNDAGDTLTLETEGPCMQDLSKTARYKEIIQVTGKDSRTFTSNIETEDGKWTKILSIEYRRKK
jgi:hypothetical protein